MPNFKEKLNQSMEKNRSLLCVGLDPLLERLPSCCRSSARPLFDFNRGIIDATADLVCAYKPQIAYYASQEAEDQLQQTLAYLAEQYPTIPVILDAKRGDIGETSQQYAREAFERYGADGVTVNPYMGTDSLTPFLDYKDKGIFILCRTSNPGAMDLQESIYPQVASLAAQKWNANHNVGLVAGATAPDCIREIRSLVGEEMPLLIPGIGAQGGNLPACMAAGVNSSGTGAIINASRSILHAGSAEDFAQQARHAALRLRDEINKYR